LFVAPTALMRGFWRRLFLIVAIFLLAIADTVSIVVADVISGTKRGTKQTKIRPD
jgi:hypothetical protein